MEVKRFVRTIKLALLRQEMNKKPKYCIYPDCLNCTYTDCIYSKLERADIIAQDKFDRELKIVEPEILRLRERQKRYFSSEKGKEAIERYHKTEKYKKSQRRYNNSEKGLERIKRYLSTEKGKESLKRKNKKKIESGKNAEYCRRYYQKMKAEKLLEAK